MLILWCVRVGWLCFQSIHVLEPLLMDLYLVVAVGVVLWRSNVPLSFETTHLLLKNCSQIHPTVLKEIQLEKLMSLCHTNITVKFKDKLLCVIPRIVISFAGHQKEYSLKALAEMTASYLTSSLT